MAKVPAKKVVALVVSFLLFATSLFVVGFIGAGTGVMKDFTRRIAYSQSEEEGTVKVSKVLDGLAPLEIPSEVSILSFKGYEKYFVTSIEEGAFDGIKYLETVKIANGIKNIENGAFSNSSIKRLEIDSTNLNFNNSLENTSICEVYFTQQSCQSDLSESNLYGVNKVIVNKDAINGFRQQYASIEYLFAPTTEENEIYVNFNNTVIDTLIAKKGEDGSVTVNDPFKGEHAYEKVENGRHYQFVWWNKTNNDSATKVEFPYTTSESLNLFAEWVPIYNIDYVMDEGTANGTLTDRFYYTGGDISIPSASKDGYTFMGWFDNEEFKGTSITTIGQDTSKDVTLYAKFLKNYNISYDLGYDGATVPDDYEVLYHQETPDITLKEPTRRGYTFGGWYANENKVSTLECKNGGDILFTAKWDIITYKIEYVYADLIQGLNTNVVEYTVETEDIVLNDLSLSGYEFIGWYSNQSMDEESKVESVAIPKNSIEDRVFYARWELNTSNVFNETTYVGVYDGVQHEIKIEVSHDAPPERNIVYSYVWYKDGEKLDIESSDTCFVKNVLDSGYYQCAVVASDGEYTSDSLSSQLVSVEISKADYDMSNVVFTDLTKVYDGNVYYPTIDTELPVGWDGVQITVTYSEGTGVVSESGKVVTATFATESSNYNAPSSMEARIIIEPAKITNIQTNAYEGIYDGKSHDSVYSSAVSVNSQPITFTYSFDVDGEYQQEIPKLKDYGIYTVYYKVSAPNHTEEKGNFYTVKIHKKEVTLEIDSVSTVYGENTAQLTAQVIQGKLYDNDTYELDTDVINTTSAGKYDINFTQLNDNYVFTVLNKEDSYTVLPATITEVNINQYSGIYDGKSHASANPSAVTVNSQKITFTYSINENGQYTETVPTFENAGTYTVYYKVNANNHNEVTGSYTVNIEKYEITIDWSVPDSIVYNGEDQAQSVVATYKDVNSQTINLAVSFKDTKSTNTIFKYVADYVATVSFANSETNYCLPQVITKQCKIEKLAVSVVANGKTMTYGDAVPSFDWKYAEGSNTFVDKDGIRLQLNTNATSKSNVGNYDITFVQVNYSNYEISYTKGTLTVEKRAVVVTVNNQSSVYGEDIKTITGNVTGGSIVNNDTNVYTLKT
ncbi:MAG: InlB B-repeat-containing protein, partial [Clostridia bacterium]|nr:InlB B-repeat-containing protein [Clostridia bacterium]